MAADRKHDDGPQGLGDGPAARAPERDSLVRSIDRALSLLEILASQGHGCRLIDLAQRAGLSPSTTHRLLTTLEQRRFVQFDRGNAVWHVGVQSFSVGVNYLGHRSFVAQALPYMRRLCEAVGETVNLGIRDDDEVVFLTRVESRDVLGAIARPGGRSPMHCSGMGKAFLAAASETDVRSVLRAKGMPARTCKSIDRPAALYRALGEIRQAGYAFDDEENGPGLRCLSSVIYDSARRPVAAISISGPVDRLGNAAIGGLGAVVRRTADDITATFGGQLPA
jgi:IclR family transcriptional regulator, acetate operon repressor